MDEENVVQLASVILVDGVGGNGGERRAKKTLITIFAITLLLLLIMIFAKFGAKLTRDKSTVCDSKRI